LQLYTITKANQILNTLKTLKMKNFIFTLTLTLSISAASLAGPILNSYPAATSTIYLDFDGQTVAGTYWNNGSTLVCAASGLTDAQITEIFNRVSEDYRPFNVNITTDESVYNAASLNHRIRVIVTPTSSWKTGVGGIAYVGSFTWGDDTPCFVFSDRLGPNNPKYIGECCSHESGHTLGLSHQSTYDNNCQLTESYATGVGTGETSWAPIMGNSYYRNMTGWDFGPTPYGCSVVQDNLTIITSQNGFSYRTDDYADVLGATAYNLGNTSFSTAGILTTTNDKDAFKFTVAQAGAWHFDAVPYSLNVSNSGADLDIKLELYNSNNVLIKSYDPLNTMKISVDTTLAAGAYYLLLSGTGNLNVDDYGSLGSYTITGLRGTLPIHDVALSGNITSNKHNLLWNIIADEPIRSQTIEYSTNGADFRPLIDVAATQNRYSYATVMSGTIYYRIKVTSVIDQTAYSNIIALTSEVTAEKTFFVSTLVNSAISVNAGDDYQFKLTDANGRTLLIGKGVKGMNRINVLNQPGGMYILQILSPSQRITERIIKQ